MRRSRLAAVLAVFTAFFVSSDGKLFDRCDLATELAKMKIPSEQISTWVCIAEHESTYNTSAVGPPNWDGSRDHGLFQINDKFWCSPPGTACGIDCRLLEDDDIRDDMKCAKRIHKAHRLQQGNGFKAWAVYSTHCSGDTSSYVSGCDALRSKTYQSYPLRQLSSLPTSYGLPGPFLHVPWYSNLPTTSSWYSHYYHPYLWTQPINYG